MTIHITPHRGTNPPGKLAEAALRFEDGPLAGLTLVGFVVWQSRAGAAIKTVTFPARSYSVNGERRSFALLRPFSDTSAQNTVRDLILAAYAEYENRDAAAIATQITA